MKHLVIIILLFLLLVQAKNDSIVFGTYESQANGTIVLNSDSTFHYSFGIDLMRTWTSGKWTFNNDTIIFQPITVFDTLRYYNNDNQPLDSLVESYNETPEVISKEDYDFYSGSSWKQNLYSSPSKLYLKKDNLYYLKKNGSLFKKKVRRLSKEKYEGWYRKTPHNTK